MKCKCGSSRSMEIVSTTVDIYIDEAVNRVTVWVCPDCARTKIRTTKVPVPPLPASVEQERLKLALEELEEVHDVLRAGLHACNRDCETRQLLARAKKEKWVK